MSIFEKIKGATEATLDNYINKAKLTEQKRRDTQIVERKALTDDAEMVGMEVGYRDRVSGVTFEILRRMALQDDVIAAIITTRVAQVRSFGVPQEDKYSIGFKIGLRDSKEESSKDDDKIIQKLEELILNTGTTSDERSSKNKMSFQNFLGMCTRDLLTYDQVAVEVIPANDGSMCYFLPVSGGSIRYASTALKHNKDMVDEFDLNQQYMMSEYQVENDRLTAAKKQFDTSEDKHKEEPYKYVQLYKGRMVRGFYEDELLLRMGNPVNDLECNGYSIGPLEMSANLVASHLLAETHNQKFFTQGFASRGILHIEGDVPPAQLEGFRRQWKQQLTHSSNAWRTPVLAGANKVNWISLQPSNREMEFSGFLDYQIKLLCALFLIAPQEINFDISKSEGGGASLGDGGKRNEVVLQHSKDRGLRPILRFFEDIVNEDIIKRYDEKIYHRYKFEFVGLDADTQQQELDRNEKEGKIFKTINEIRAEHDMEKVEGWDFILDPTFMQWFGQFSKEGKEQNEQAMQNQGGAPGQDFGGGAGQDNTGGDQGGPQGGDGGGQGGDQGQELDTSMFGNKSFGTKGRFGKAKGYKAKAPQLIKVEYYKK